MPHDGSAGAGLPQPGTAEAGGADSGAPPGSETPVSARALTFAGAASAVLYLGPLVGARRGRNPRLTMCNQSKRNSEGKVPHEGASEVSTRIVY